MDYLQYCIQGLYDRWSSIVVLNLVINGLPSILSQKKWLKSLVKVLNLVINGLPSIP